MRIVLNRIDERLVHGQILVSWVKKLEVKSILIVDDQLFNDQFAETILKMSLPSGINLKIFDTERGGDYFKTFRNETPPNAILLMRTPLVAKKLWDSGYRPAEINIGGMSAAKSRHSIYHNIYATKDEIEILREFIRNGTEVFIQVVFAEKKVSVKDLIQK